MALVLVLLVLGLVGVSVGVLVLLATGESLIAGHYRSARQARAAADAAFEYALAELQAVPDWDGVLSGGVQAGLGDLTGRPLVPPGVPLDPAVATAALQARSDRSGRWGADAPVWRLFAYGPLGALTAVRVPQTGLYVLAWVADDAGDGDGDPGHDGNGVVQVWAESCGPAGVRQAVAGGVARLEPAPAPLRRVWWRGEH